MSASSGTERRQGHTSTRNDASAKQLAQSLETWQALKVENGDYYRYEVSAASLFGSLHTTTLTVREGVVVTRVHEVREFGNDDEETIVESWTEEGAAVGSHDSGAEPITVDTHYSRCRDGVLSQNPETNDIYLGFQDSSVLSYCAYVPKDVADDGGGYVIKILEFP